MQNKLPKYSEWYKLHEEQKLFESMRTTSGGIGKAIKGFLSQVDSKTYSVSTSPGRIKVSGSKSDEEIVGDLKKYYKTKDPIEYTVIQRSERPQNIKSNKVYSDEYSTIEYKVPGTDSWKWLILARKNPLSGRTSIHFKEILVCLFSKKQNDFEPLTKENYYEQIAHIYERLSGNLEGMGIFTDNAEVQEVLNDLKELGTQEWNKGRQEAINNAKSCGKKIALAYPAWSINRNNIFKEVKSIGGRIAQRSGDKWCPMDIMLVNPKVKSTSQIMDKVNEALQATSETEKLGKINRLFEHTWGEGSEMLCGISLKEEASFHGKAKGALPKKGDVVKEYNITKEDKLLFKGRDDKAKLEEVNRKRKFVEEALKNRSTLFKASKGSDFGKPWNNVNGVFDKYAALKMTGWLLTDGEGKNIFLDLVEYGLSLGKNPAFFKLVGNKLGGNATLTAFPNGGGVSFVKDKDQIIVDDRNSSIRVLFKYSIDFQDKVWTVDLSCRTNSKTSKQVTLEIESFKQKK